MRDHKIQPYGFNLFHYLAHENNYLCVKAAFQE